MDFLQACIFDLDGVLVSTEVYHFKAWQRLAYSIGIDIDEEFNEQLKGVSRAVCIDLILQHGKQNRSNEEKQALASKKNEWYLEYISHIGPHDAFKGVENLLKELKAAGIKTAVGSASRNAQLLLKKLNLVHYFDAIIDGTHIAKAKPNPEVFLLGASHIGAYPQKCVVFEDAISGVQAAKAANMYCIGVGSAELLPQADAWIDSFANVSLQTIYSMLANNAAL